MSKNGSVVDADVGIIGGGPAGAAVAAYLGKAGVKCCVLEREIFPRFHIGESFVPSSTRIFKELGFLEQMESNGFLHKRGAAWTGASGAKTYQDCVFYDPFTGNLGEDIHPCSMAEIRFEEREQPGVDQKYTYHVARDKFDLLLLQHAHKLGAQVYEGIAVQGVEFKKDEYPKICFSMGSKKSSMRVRVVVDASGRRTVLGNQLKLKIMDNVFDQYAIHTWFEGYERQGWSEHTFVHFLPITNSWIWQIPITDTVTSIGVVTQKRNFSGSRQSREQFFWDCVASRPEMLELLRKSRQMHPLRDEGDYSYGMNQICGDNFVMIGDAARFVDPIFSSGVSIALNGARFSSLDILAALEKGDFTKKAFSNYETTIRWGTRNWYEFIRLYYRLNVLFTAFILDPRYRIDVLKLLQGDLYDEEEPPVLKKMRDIVTAVEKNPQHVWHKHIGELTSNAFKPSF
jgi:1H-pyrrole-2-carbonyl-[peptidyl-carrier protein] chlorinase